MRLYATTTSERASKGQGGNDYLLISILNDKKDTVLQLHVTSAQDHLRGDHLNFYLYNPLAEYIDMSQNDFIKGKKQ